MNMVTSRASPHNLSNHPFETVAQCETYSDHSIGSVYFILVESLVSEQPELQKLHLQLDHISSHLSRCLGTVNLLRGLVHNGRRGRCYVPNDLLLKHGASHEDFLRFSASKPVCDVCFDLSVNAKHHMDIVHNLFSEMSGKSVQNIFYSVIFAELYLQKIEAVNFNVFSQELAKKDTNLPWKLWWKSLGLRFRLKKK
jgi:phytoene/squalene synthetase